MTEPSGTDQRGWESTSSAARSLARARQALPCLPYRRAFYDLLLQQGLGSDELASRSDRNRLCRRFPGVNRCEDQLIWLIRLGVLRREVDGQGLTERVRLTPMGREVLAGWPGDIPPAGPWARLLHALRRHWPRL